MRVHEFVRDDERPLGKALNEIVRLDARVYTGGDLQDVEHTHGKKTYKKLPGGSGLLYSIEKNSGEYIITLWEPFDPNKHKPPQRGRYEFGSEYRDRVAAWKKNKQRNIIGKLTLGSLRYFPLDNALSVNKIAVDKNYRGMGLAKAMYGIVLTIMKRPLVAGNTQTPGGRRNWVSLSQIPGVEVKGYIAFNDSELDPLDHSYTPDKKKVERRLDTIMGELGGQYFGTSSGNYHYFAFDVLPNSTGTELEAYAKQNLAKVYGNDVIFVTGLYAIWTGS